MCNHKDFKIAERLFNKFGKHVATAIFCLKCGSSKKIIEPKKENDEISFALNEKAMVINFMDTKKQSILMHSEMDKEDAIRLAHLILFNYKNI
jgi:hypothetical protein